MKILISGNHNPGFMNSVELRERGIRQAGQECMFYDDRSFFLPGRLRSTLPFAAGWDLARINKELVSAAGRYKPDLYIAAGGHRILPETVKAIKEQGVKTVLWTTDPPAELGTIEGAAVFYDMVFCSGSEMISILRSKGVKNIEWLPFACDPEIHVPRELTPGEKRDLASMAVFVGSYYPNREDVFEKISDLDIAIWGPGWEEADISVRLAEHVRGGSVGPEIWTKIYSASQMVLMVHYDDGSTPCEQASPRVFEAMACGTFLLCDRQGDVSALFRDGEDLVLFDGPEDLKQKILYYSERPEQRAKIAERGRKKVIGEHTYAHRIKEILTVVKGG